MSFGAVVQGLQKWNYLWVFSVLNSQIGWESGLRNLKKHKPTFSNNSQCALEQGSCSPLWLTALPEIIVISTFKFIHTEKNAVAPNVFYELRNQIL